MVVPVVSHSLRFVPMSTCRLISVVCWKLPRIVARVDDDDLALEGAGSGGLREETGGFDFDGVVLGDPSPFLPSSDFDGEGDEVSVPADDDWLAAGRVFAGSFSPGPPATCQISHPARAVGTSAASVTVSGPPLNRRGRRGPSPSPSKKPSLSGPTYDTWVSLTVLLQIPVPVRRRTRRDSVAETSVNAPDSRARR